MWLIFLVLLFIFTVKFLSDAIRWRTTLFHYAAYGIACGLVVLGFCLAQWVLLPQSFAHISAHRAILLLVVEFVRIVLFTCMGMYCCSYLGIGASLFSCRLPDVERRKTRAVSGLLFALVVVIFSVDYSLVLFKLASPYVSETVRRISEANAAESGIANSPSLLLVPSLLLAALNEEIVLRLGIQNYLAKRFELRGHDYWFVIVITAALWALMHGPVFGQGWVKIAQIFPIGLALGYLFRKCGTEACILAHGAFNVVMMYLQPYCVKI